MEIIELKDRSPIKMWTRGVCVEEKALEQLRNLSSMPFIFKWIAAMPDCHWGMGATVGSVIPTRKAIIPAAVGVDIGCGMVAAKTSLKAEQLPDDLRKIRLEIEAAVPHGRTDNGGANDKGSWSSAKFAPSRLESAWAKLDSAYAELIEQNPGAGLNRANPINHLGTLGTGNHFIEICLDEDDAVWIMLHSGSRGVGNRIGRYFIEKAKEEMERWLIELPDPNLAYLPQGTEAFDKYWTALTWAQAYARTNRQLMLESVIEALENSDLPEFEITSEVVNCHHNYASIENHYGVNIFVTRKGAVRARLGDLGIIPGSMGNRSYIVRGKGNEESFHSCSHGAGRAMSRSAARKRFSVEDHIKATEGVECRKDADVLDETPGAYKPINSVMEAQSDLVDVVHELKQVVCVKG
ncbi:MAG: RtcB family protein [Cyanobacteriota/Melainabacteria group bacterium]